jgi:hypothetical protein
VKRLALLGLMVMVLAAGSAAAGPAAVAAPNGDGVERVVFVHYPRGVRPDHPGKGTSSCPDATTCADYKYSGYRWAASDLPVPWEVNYANSGGSAGSFGSGVDGSFSAWDAKTGATLFESGATGNCTASSLDNEMDGVNCVSWQDISGQYPNAIAVTFVWRTRATKNIVEVDTVMGSQYDWAYDAPSCDVSDASCNPPTVGGASYDVRDILTHELGHWLMLNDLYNSRDQELTMYGYGALGELKKDSLGYGDVLGVRKIYGP